MSKLTAKITQTKTPAAIVMGTLNRFQCNQAANVAITAADINEYSDGVPYRATTAPNVPLIKLNNKIIAVKANLRLSTKNSAKPHDKTDTKTIDMAGFTR